MTLVRILPQADLDIEEAADIYFDSGGLEVALRFHAAVERALKDLAIHPGIGSEQSWRSVHLVGILRWQIAKPFDVYQVFYRYNAEHLEVVRVLHGARNNERDLRRP